MDSRYDVAVIGGGVIGVCCAYSLNQKGMKVLLIEKDEIASGCSAENAGLIVPSHAVPLASSGALGDGLRWLLDAESPFYIKPRFDPVLFNWMLRFASSSRPGVVRRSLPVLRDLLFAGASLFAELAADGGFDFGYRSNGSLWVCLSQERLEREQREADLLEEFDIPVQVMDRREVHDIEPALLPQVSGGLFYPKDGHIDPRRFVVGLAEKARGAGVDLWTNTEATGFETSNGEITGIRTQRGDVRAEQVVLAAGSWSPQIARVLRLRLPIQPAKGYSITLENPDPSPKLPLLFGEAGAVANPLGSTLRLAGTLELAGMDFSINRRRVEAIRRGAAAYLPGIAAARVIDVWRGLRPCTPDGLPILSHSDKFDNLIVAAGHAMLGMSLGPITGRLVSQLACREKTDLDLTRFNLQRF